MTSIASSKARVPGRLGLERSASSPKESALRARANRRPPTPKTPRRRPRLSLRTALLVLAVVPGIALASLWAVTSGQTFLDFQRQAGQGLLAQKAGQPSNIVYYNLQEERRLSAEALARPGSVTDALRRQRQLTDDAVRVFQTLSGETADSAPAEVRTAVAEARRAMGQLAEQRAAVDRAAIDQQALFTFYTDLIAVDLRLFTALSHVDNGEVTWISKTLVDAFWAKEMLAREDAVLARGWPSGRLAVADLQQVQQAIGAQNHLFSVKVAPYVPTAEAPVWRALMDSPAWQAKAAVEQQLLRPTAPEPNGTVKLPPAQEQWRQAIDQLNPALVKAIEQRTEGVVEVGKGSIIALLVKVAVTSLVGLAAVVAVVLTTWRLTRSLRRRIRELQTQAEELERTLPEVVERLGRGEQVDVEAETRAITTGASASTSGSDEIDRLGQALNLARTSALETAVRQAEQHRGFERLLQRIARRTQLLIGQQLRRLDELERKHEDPEVLEGLFDLDHLTARLRRYEENLVILAGGQPQRRWRKPVPLLDVLRAAQGEVQDYRRIMLDVEGHPWLNERAVGPVAHVIAELMENAATFSKPPTPVEVRAAMVGRGLAVEIEDRGLGMDPAQYDAANELMSRPPRTDVLARADDIRLGFYVVARLAANAGLRVEFRPSAFGGTRAVVLIPAELVIDGDAGLPDATPVEPIPLAVRRRRTLLADPGDPADPVAPAAVAGGAAYDVSSVGDAPEPAPAVGAPDTTGATGIAGTAGTAGTVGTVGTTGATGPTPGPDEAAVPRPRPVPAGADEPDDVPDRPSVFEPTAAAARSQAQYTAHQEYADYEPVEYLEPAEPAQPLRHDQADGPDTTPGRPVHPDFPVFPDIAYARVAPVERPAGRPAEPPIDHAGGQPPLPQRIRQASLAAELRLPPQPAHGGRPVGPYGAQPHGTGPYGAGPHGGEQYGTGAYGTGASDDRSGGSPSAGSAFRSPAAPHRSGAAIGAFQRQSRAARGLGDRDTLHGPLPRDPQPGSDAAPAPSPSDFRSPDHRSPGPHPAGPIDPQAPAPGHAPWALPGPDSRTPRTDDQ
ncbi:nitrate- and nitrite sensing domain-containing protein [Kitasatospora sp. NPDC054939]